MKILAAGSMNMDIVTRVHHHPSPGETISGINTNFFSGGKGANQAVAAVRSGAEVSMAGSLGDDFFGSEIIRLLSMDNISLTYVQTGKETTGTALITIDDEGENNIILSKGANGDWEDSDLVGIDFTQYNAILLQNEIPWEMNALILEKASKLGVKTFFNPAPALQITKRYLSMIDVLILNEIEAKELTGIPIDSVEEGYAAGEKLIQQGVSEVIITLGKQGSLYVDGNGQQILVPAFDVNTIDTTAAGDTFIGSFAAKYVSGWKIASSLRYASAAAALTVTTEGAQNSIPIEEEVTTFINKRSDI